MSVAPESTEPQTLKATKRAEAVTPHFLTQDENMTLEVNHSNCDTVNGLLKKWWQQPQQRHRILFTSSWTVTAGHERELPVEQESPSEPGESGHCGPGPKGQRGCRAVPGLPLTHRCSESLPGDDRGWFVYVSEYHYSNVSHAAV